MVSENLVLNCCKKPSSAVLNSLNLQENHLQVTVRKLWTVLVEGFGMQQSISFPPKLFKENIEYKNVGVAPREIGLFCFMMNFF